MSKILEGVRVADFGKYIDAPYCASLLADFGAEVIRVEDVGGGVDRRVVPLGEEDAGASFFACNHNKKSLSLNTTTDEGKKVFAKLISSVDVVIASLPPRALAAAGLDYETLRAIKPDIILTSVNAFGSGGPWSDRVGFDGVAQAMSGLCYMTGYPGDPQKAYGPYVDFSTGMFAALGTMGAIQWKQKTGEGQHVEAAMVLAALVPAMPLLTEQGVTNINRKPAGNRSQVGAPADMFSTKDGGRFIMQVSGDDMYRRWAKLMGDETLMTDPRFKTDGTRVREGGFLSQRMQEWSSQQTLDEALTALAKAKLPTGPVLKPQEVLEHEHLQALRTFDWGDYPGMPHAAPMLRPPVRLSGSPLKDPTPPPLAGADTNSVLSDLGFDSAQINALRENGIV
ncbi:MAG: CoA transferase [Caulobacterales bacterium]